MAEPTEIAGKVVGKAKEIGAALEGYSGIFRKLKEEHGEVKVLIKRLQASEDATVVRELFPTIRAELTSHMRGEEDVFYPLLAELEETVAEAKSSKDEHRLIATLLDKLSTLEILGPGWMSSFDELARAVERHVDHEENIVFPKLKELVSDERAEALGRMFVEVKERELGALRHH